MIKHPFIPIITCLISTVCATTVAEPERSIVRADSPEKIEQIIKSGVDVNTKTEISPAYTRTVELIFTSPTGGKATCPVTGRLSTIRAEKIGHTGSFTPE